MARGEMNQDPVQDDYFNTAALDSYSDALVREAIQNSLDAKSDDSHGPVRVRITFPPDSDLPDPADAAHYLDSLWDHIKATPVIEHVPSTDKKVPFLLFEDFGTRGLVGDPHAFEDPEHGELADFFYFWRNVGRGKKTGEERGRWGLGKTMFPASSEIHAFFGLTLRDGDRRPLLMGQSTLSIHHIDGKKHCPYGFYADQAKEDQFALPITDSNRIGNFCSTFSISRQSETGLSVVVPYPRDGINAPDVLTSVVRHYFYPILAGGLLVEVAFEGEVVTVESNTIDDVVREYFTKESSTILGTLDLAKWYITVSDEDKERAQDPIPNRSPIWKAEMFTTSQINSFAEALDSLQPVCARIPVYVLPQGGQRELSHFDVVLERDPELEGSLDEFIRSGITITGVSSLRENGIRALVIADDQPISTMLGDSENPAHTEWQDRSTHFIGKYRMGKSTLAFVRAAPQGLLRLLNKHSEQIDDTTLRQLFPDPSSKGGKEVNKPGRVHKPRGKQHQKIKVDVKSRPKIFRLSRNVDGFTASLAEAGQKATPMRIRLRLAYDVRRGNPYSRWNVADFDLGEDLKRITHSGGDLLNADGNRLEILAISSDWKLQLTGFDPQRDLIVDIRREAS